MKNEAQKPRSSEQRAAIDLGLRLPLRIEALEESVKVTDAAGVLVGYFYFENNEERRQQTKRLTRDVAIVLAQRFARMVTDGGEE